jgi:cell division protein FtsQ
LAKADLRAVEAAVNGRHATLDVESTRRPLFRRRRSNRRAAVQRRGLVTALADGGAKLGRSVARAARLVGKVLLLLAISAGCVWGGRWAIIHVVNSPQFQISNIEFSATPHLSHSELLRLAGVTLGDKLLGIDTDQVAARIATHPWVAAVRTSRRLPSALVIEVTEKHAVAAAALSGLYLVDDNGRPFKRATMDEADGLPVLTGIERTRYAQMPEISEAAFREAMVVLGEYRSRSGRPAVGEVNIDPAFGFSLFLLDGGAEIRLGQGNLGKKLAQLDQIFDAVETNAGGLAALRIVHLDLPESGRVPVLFRDGDKASVDPAKPPAAKLAKN